jgi:hypothetical protein
VLRPITLATTHLVSQRLAQAQVGEVLGDLADRGETLLEDAGDLFVVWRDGCCVGEGVHHVLGVLVIGRSTAVGAVGVSEIARGAVEGVADQPARAADDGGRDVGARVEREVSLERGDQHADHEPCLAATTRKAAAAVGEHEVVNPPASGGLSLQHAVDDHLRAQQRVRIVVE